MDKTERFQWYKRYCNRCGEIMIFSNNVCSVFMNDVRLPLDTQDDEAYYEEVKFIKNSDGGKILGDSIGADIYRTFRDYLHFSSVFCVECKLYFF